MNMRKQFKIISLLIVFILFGCASTSPTRNDTTYYNTYDDYTGGVYVEEAVAEKGYGYDQPYESSVEEGRKITKDYYINMDTKNIENFLVEINGLIESHKGYIQYSNESLGDSSYKYSNLSIKIPADSVEEFINQISALGNIKSKSLNTSDITSSYNKTESMLNSLKIQEERLLEIMEEATSVSDLITVENQLTYVRSDIQYYSQLLEEYKNQVNYSLVEINVYETKEGTIDVEDNFFGKLKNEFINAISDLIYFIQGLILMIVSVWPFIIILIVFIIIIRSIINKRKNKKLNKVEINKNE